VKHNAAEPQPKNGNGKNDASNRQVAKNAKNGNSKINLELRNSGKIFSRKQDSRR